MVDGLRRDDEPPGDLGVRRALDEQRQDVESAAASGRRDRRSSPGADRAGCGARRRRAGAGAVPRRSAPRRARRRPPARRRARPGPRRRSASRRPRTGSRSPSRPPPRDASPRRSRARTARRGRPARRRARPARHSQQASSPRAHSLAALGRERIRRPWVAAVPVEVAVEPRVLGARRRGRREPLQLLVETARRQASSSVSTASGVAAPRLQPPERDQRRAEADAAAARRASSEARASASAAAHSPRRRRRLARAPRSVLHVAVEVALARRTRARARGRARPAGRRGGASACRSRG